MALDVYVGSLTRYYAGAWKNSGQRLAKEMGADYQIVGPRVAAQTDSVNNPDEIKDAVITWRSTLAQHLEAGLGWRVAFEWDESIDSPYFTERPAWDGYACLVLLAAYEEHPELKRPSKLVTSWDKDPAWLASIAKGFKSRYAQILSPELWLPADFDFVFQAEDLVGDKVFIGSTLMLLVQLQELEKRVFPRDVELAEDSREAEYSFDRVARFCLGQFLSLAKRASSHKLPMKLDY